MSNHSIDRASNRRVLHVIDTLGPGGAEGVFAEVAAGVRDFGFESTAIVPGPGWLASRLGELKVPVCFVSSGGSFNATLLAGLVRELRRTQANLVHAHLLGSVVYGVLAGRLTGTPVIATFHGMVDIASEERFRRAKASIVRRGVARAVAVSRALATDLAAAGFVNPRRTVVVHNGIDVGRFARARVPRGTRLGTRPGQLVVGALGNVRTAKAYDVLVDVAVRVHAAGVDAAFVVAGEGAVQDLEALRSRARSSGAPEVVRFIGFQSDAAAFLHDLDVFLLTSDSEGFSLATVEAMASGLPVVATRSGGPEEIVRDGVDGVLVPCRDVPAIAAAIVRLAADGPLRARLGREAVATATRAFSTEAMIRSYVDTYREVLGGVSTRADLP